MAIEFRSGILLNWSSSTTNRLLCIVIFMRELKVGQGRVLRKARWANMSAKANRLSRLGCEPT
jgi:hypothetical protein